MFSLLVSRCLFSSSARAYKILGVKPNCTLKQAKTAYYKQAQIYHPDKNSDGNAKQKFNSINQAYNQVVDDIENGTAFKQTQFAQSYTQGYGFGFEQNFGNDYSTYQSNKDKKVHAESRWKEYFKNPHQFYYDTKMDQMMKQFILWEEKQKQIKKQRQAKRKKQQKDRLAKEQQKQKQRAQQRAQKLNISINVELTAAQFKSGCTKEVNVKRQSPCQCQRKNHCRLCNGTGFKVQFSFDGVYVMDSMCDCMKKKRNRNCIICQGKGFKVRSTLQLVRIPKNSSPNQILKVSGKGHRSDDNIGDLLLTLIGKIKGDKVDFDLHSNQNISVAQAVLGTKLQIQTLNGKFQLNVPKGFISGNVITLKNQGYLKDNKKNLFGDHFVKINVKTPTNISSKQQELYKQILQIQKMKSKEDQKKDQ